MNEALLEQAQQLHQQSESTEERLSFIDRQVTELTEFLLHLDALHNTDETELFSSMGKGLFLRTTLRDKIILVDVGAGVVVQKGIREVQTVIRSQLENLRDMRNETYALLQTLHRQFETLISHIEQTQSSSRKTI